MTSLAVLVAAAGSWQGYPIVDLLIGVAILFITWDAMKTIWYRLMDAVDPELIDRAEAVIRANERVLDINRLRMRWVGHCLHAEVYISLCANLKTDESHEIAEQVRHALFHDLEALREITVHIDPWIGDLGTQHKLTSGHEPVPQLILKN